METNTTTTPTATNTTTTATSSNHPLCANQNLMHVKFHVNKFQVDIFTRS